MGKYFKVHFQLLAAMCIFAGIIHANRLFATHRKLYLSSVKTLYCYNNHHKISQPPVGGALWAKMNSFLIQKPQPSKQATTALRQKACLTLLRAVETPLEYISKQDSTLSNVQLCKKAAITQLLSLKSTITYYKNILNNPKTTPTMTFNMTSLTQLAKKQASSVQLLNGKRGVTPEVLRNYQILSMIQTMAMNLRNNCR